MNCALKFVLQELVINADCDFERRDQIADHILRRVVQQHAQRQRIEQNRFAGAGLPGKHREPGIEPEIKLIDQDNVARLRYVTLGQLVDDLRVIKEGLSAGDRVVVNGLMRVRQGVKVTPEERPASPQASVPARATADKTD